MISAEIKSNTNQDLTALFKGNWKRALNFWKTNPDPRSQFEALYDCFENVGQLTTGETSGKKMIEKLKASHQINPIYRVFFSLYNKPDREKSFSSYLKKLRALGPIRNNTTGEEVFLTKDRPLDTFLDTLYTVRNNVRHGRKEFSDRSNEILSLTSATLFLLLVDIYDIIFPKEAEGMRKERENVVERQRVWSGARDFVLVIIGLTIFGAFIGWIFTTSLDITPGFCYNANRGSSVTDWVEWILCSVIFNV